MQLELATFAAGCFWGAEAAFRRLDGVVSARVGWTGGHGPAPADGGSCHAEAVEVVFDPERIGYHALLEAFLAMHDPLDDAARGADGCGPERSAIFVHDPAQEHVARGVVARETSRRGRELTTTIEPAGPFVAAPDADQRYLEQRGG